MSDRPSMAVAAAGVVDVVDVVAVVGLDPGAEAAVFAIRMASWIAWVQTGWPG